MCHSGLGYRLFYVDAVPDEAFAFYLFPREKNQDIHVMWQLLDLSSHEPDIGKQGPWASQALLRVSCSYIEPNPD